MMEHGDNTRQSNHNYSVQDLTDDLSYSFCFMMSALRGRRLSFRVMGKAWKNLEDKRIIDYHMIIG